MIALRKVEASKVYEVPGQAAVNAAIYNILQTMLHQCDTGIGVVCAAENLHPAFGRAENVWLGQKPAESENRTVDPAICEPFLVEEKFGLR